MGLTWLTAVLLALPRNWIQARLYQYSIYFTLTTQIHLPIGNKVDGFFFWCIPNYQDQVKKILSLTAAAARTQDLWRIFQLYMMIIVLIIPSIIMTAAYFSISRKLLSLTSTEQRLNRSLEIFIDFHKKDLLEMRWR